MYCYPSEAGIWSESSVLNGAQPRRLHHEYVYQWIILCTPLCFIQCVTIQPKIITMCFCLFPTVPPPVCQWVFLSYENHPALQEVALFHSVGPLMPLMSTRGIKSQTETPAEAHLADCGFSRSVVFRHTVLVEILARLELLMYRVVSYSHSRPQMDFLGF